MAFGVAGVGIKDDIAVDLAESGVGRSKGGQHRAIDGGGAVAPGEGLGEIPQDLPCIFPGGCTAIAENLITSILDGGAFHIDEHRGADGSDDIDAVELPQGQATAIQVLAVQAEDIQSRIAAGVQKTRGISSAGNPPCSLGQGATVPSHKQPSKAESLDWRIISSRVTAPTMDSTDLLVCSRISGVASAMATIFWIFSPSALRM